MILALSFLLLQGFNLNLMWDSNPEPDVLSYNLYSAPTCAELASQSMQAVSSIVQVPFPRFTVLMATFPQCYGVTALNTAGNESGFSNLLLVDVPPVQPVPGDPTGLKFTITIQVTVQ